MSAVPVGPANSDDVSASPSPLSRLLDITVFAPIGVATQVATDFPKLVQEGRNRVAVARFIGEMAVTFGRQQFEQRLAEVRRSDGVEPAQRPDVAVDQPLPTPEPAPAAAIPELVVEPFEGYDALPAANLVQRLARLTQYELGQVREYEAAHRARRTVLAKVDQLVIG